MPANCPARQALSLGLSLPRSAGTHGWWRLWQCWHCTQLPPGGTDASQGVQVQPDRASIPESLQPHARASWPPWCRCRVGGPEPAVGQGVRVVQLTLLRSSCLGFRNT